MQTKIKVITLTWEVRAECAAVEVPKCWLTNRKIEKRQIFFRFQGDRLTIGNDNVLYISLKKSEINYFEYFHYKKKY